MIDRQNENQIEPYNVEILNDDAIRLYDYGKVYDPLTDPTRRVPRHEIPPLYFKRLLDIPTRGYPDSYTQLGLLVRENHKEHTHNDSNNILRLFGRQEYPGSSNYEYYTALNSGNDNIKVPLNIKRRELYDGDTIYLDILHDKYIVHLHKYDMPRYYPDLF